MLTLFLVRHAKSSWSTPGLDDFDRALNDRGERNAPFMGKELAKRGENPDMLVSSTAKRAYTTAKLIAAELGYAKTDIVKNDELYLAGVKTWLAVVNQLDMQHTTVMIFGHNDGITEFANYLTDARIENIPTCGIVKIKFDFDDWKMVSRGNGELVYFDYPKRYKENLE